MKTSFLSFVLLAFSLAFSSRAAAQTNEAKELYDAVMEQKAELAAMAQQPPVYSDDLGGDAEVKLAALSVQMFDYAARVEKTKGKMTAAKLAAFKAEAAQMDQKMASITDDLNTSARETRKESRYVSCANTCANTWPRWWQVVLRAHCYFACLIVGF